MFDMRTKSPSRGSGLTTDFDLSLFMSLENGRIDEQGSVSRILLVVRTGKEQNHL